jgi:hypothetical protein
MKQNKSVESRNYIIQLGDFKTVHDRRKKEVMFPQMIVGVLWLAKALLVIEKQLLRYVEYLKAFPVDNGRPRFIIFLLRDPHLLES